MKKLITPCLFVLSVVFISCFTQVNAQERRSPHSDHEISAEDEQRIDEQSLLEKMTPEEKAHFVKRQNQENRSTEKKEVSIPEERARKMNAIREKENLKRHNYNEYVRLYIGDSEKNNRKSQISEEEFKSMPPAKQEHIRSNPDKYSLVKKGGVK